MLDGLISIFGPNHVHVHAPSRHSLSTVADIGVVVGGTVNIRLYALRLHVTLSHTSKSSYIQNRPSWHCGAGDKYLLVAELTLVAHLFLHGSPCVRVINKRILTVLCGGPGPDTFEISRDDRHTKVAATRHLVKTASSGSSGFKGSGNHLIGSVKQFLTFYWRLRWPAVGLESIKLTTSTSSVFPAEVDVGQSVRDTYSTGEMPMSPLPV